LPYTDLLVGFTSSVPRCALAAWGVRLPRTPADDALVWPTPDQVHEAGDPLSRSVLRRLLNEPGGAWKDASSKLKAWMSLGLLAPRSSCPVVLHHGQVMIAASCQGSHDYVYVAAWLPGQRTPGLLHPYYPPQRRKDHEHSRDTTIPSNS